MKWSLVGVILLGLIASLCVAAIVAILPAYLQGPNNVNEGIPEVQIVVAAKPVPAMTIVDASAVSTRKILKSSAPEQYLSDPAQVIGKVPVVPVLEGQAFSRNNFASDGSGAQLASALANGKRAVGVLLPEDAGLLGLLYPGSIVDVLAAYKTKDAGGTVSQTILQGIQVLAVEERSIVSSDSAESGSAKIDRTRKRMVTLMVDSDQARILHTAQQQGNVSLAMRNPLDSKMAAGAQPRKAARPLESPAWEVTILRDGKPEVKKFSVARVELAGAN